MSNGGSPQTRPIICLTLDGEYVKRYEYLSEAVKDGFEISSVRQSLKSRSRTSFGHIFMYEDEYKENGAKKYVKPVSSCKKPIIQCDLKGNFVARYDSVVEASEKTGFIRSNISSNLTNASKTSNGFIFIYEKDFPIKDISLHQKKRKGRKIVQIDIKTGKPLNVFDSISKAGEYIGKSYKNIQKILNIPDRTAYGYRWMDYEKYLSQHGNTEVSNQSKE